MPKEIKESKREQNRKKNRVLFFRVCDILAENEDTSVRRACELGGVAQSTFQRWVDDPEILMLEGDDETGRYARALDQALTRLCHEIEDIAAGRHRRKDNEKCNEFDSANVARDKLMLDTKKFLYARMMKNKFADLTKHELTGNDGSAIKIEQEIDLSKLTNEQLNSLIGIHTALRSSSEGD